MGSKCQVLLVRIFSRTTIIALLVLIGAVLVTALILPPSASAWFRNSANARIARAMSLPADAPARLTALNDAEAQLAQARAWSNDCLLYTSPSPRD